MNQVPSVSVVIPFYSGEPWLAAALESIRSQTVPVHEIIIICDGCGCDLSHLVDSEAHVRIITTENGGPGRARNRGIELAEGEYIAFLDADDIWDPRKIEGQLTRMVQTGAVWSHTSYSTFLDGQPATQTSKIVHSGRRHDGHIYPALLSSCSIATPTVMISTEILRADLSLRFADSMRFAEDAFFWARLAARHRVLGLDEVLTRVRIRGSNAAQNPAVQLQARSALWTEICRDPVGFPQGDISLLARTAFQASGFAAGVYDLLACRTSRRPAQRALAVLLYSVPWCLFKMDAWFSQSKDGS